MEGIFFFLILWDFLELFSIQTVGYGYVICIIYYVELCSPQAYSLQNSYHEKMVYYSR